MKNIKILISSMLFVCCALSISSWKSDVKDDMKAQIVATLRKQTLAEAAWALQQKPVTVTAETCPRSAGGKHDFYSEGDYWWPDEKNPHGPYIQKDGMTNPDNFVAHRHAMIRFSQIIGALASAYKITGNVKYIKAAQIHLRAWFTDPETLMNPNLQYAQAIKGVATGRGIGIIDTIQLMEVVQGLEAMEGSAALDKQTLTGVKEWFSKYITWLTTHPYGKDEMNAKNNHGTCWCMQTACFAKFTGNTEVMKFCSDRFKNVLLPGQIEANGSFPQELRRTKPYGYSIFNLDAMTTLCQILSTKEDNLWEFKTPDGRNIRKGIEFLQPFLADKSKWPYQHDVMHWESWPVAQPALAFGAVAYHDQSFLDTWKKLDHNPKDEEIIRNLPVRHVLIWM
ncbi:alginate lyase family protein [Mucilaginibacter boryungensis]|uniref:Alginate lyase family protein n=1 Tax=Mucilaginibacter boryungensis TaxID=768480 RepID=A0ABR9XC51_9SPHI|nr:alginate lyase family protein [Mucilaginibacter boryungensis]MBE9664730.1 alginate lyase family protein [Mucilaginibacter boryungensis]